MARKHTEAELLHFIGLHLKGVPYQTLVDQHHLKLSNTTFMNYVHRYQDHGMEGIRYQKNYRSYSKEFKQKIVAEYLQTGYGFSYLAIKYNIPSKITVNKWVNRYTEGKENETYSPKSEVYHMTGIKKTYEEKLKIVEDYIDNRLTYQEAAEKNQVSYNNIYSWVNKYKKHGPKGLEDNRGRGKPTEIQTAEERLKAEVETLKARNKWLEMENDALKKRRKIAGSLKSQESDKKRNI
ncbi:helix-turn-helix domain-containing protein [Jeotgalibaca sp. MA1X17-3]|uniref:helix-turn-helix domain-containing protein n=1 Tax=Jeotgalibaca sp. MA1X17-3 TaxID=2908211 RepID=UPI001F1A0CAF|nr:helix-turn-helix domain-containing protein [Jeotgalibaca sp. MA1X17-3]UJF15159.1 helix-turn-helix domain-containing protein [Jeotgalibaca sp. MA1X17-3]UJF16331.1 helix-turn-helix domain-containing protein [Jeotgalibaca sp. MA1X17-3]